MIDVGMLFSISVKAISMESQSIVIGIGNMGFLFMILLSKWMILTFVFFFLLSWQLSERRATSLSLM
jgi:hypothetical protein